MSRRCIIRLVIFAACLAGLPNALAKDIIPTPADTPVLGEFEPALIDAMLKTDNRDAGLSDAMRDDAVQHSRDVGRANARRHVQRQTLATEDVDQGEHPLAGRQAQLELAPERRDARQREPEDADACIEGKECVYLGTQVAQLAANIKKRT